MIAGLWVNDCRTFCYMQPHIWHYYIIGRVQPEDLEQMIYRFRYFWVNRLNMAMNRVPK